MCRVEIKEREVESKDRGGERGGERVIEWGGGREVERTIPYQ